jgi:hypothetical protein
MREARELRDSFKGTLDPPKEKPAQPATPAPSTGGGTADDDESTRGA